MSGFKNISVAELDEMLQAGNVRLLDVRTEAEIAQGMIPQGEAFPLHLVPARIDEIDKTATTIFYCKSGMRSAQAAAFAADKGCTNIFNLEGGIIEWVNAGLPINA